MIISHKVDLLYYEPNLHKIKCNEYLAQEICYTNLNKMSEFIDQLFATVCCFIAANIHLIMVTVSTTVRLLTVCFVYMH